MLPRLIRAISRRWDSHTTKRMTITWPTGTADVYSMPFQPLALTWPVTLAWPDC